MIIFHKENYKKLKADDPSLATYNDSEKLKKYNYDVRTISNCY